MDKIVTETVVGRGGITIRIHMWRGCVVSQNFRPELVNGHFNPPPPESEQDESDEEES